jgi:hypothetical protein
MCNNLLSLTVHLKFVDAASFFCLAERSALSGGGGSSPGIGQGSIKNSWHFPIRAHFSLLFFQSEFFPSSLLNP